MLSMREEGWGWARGGDSDFFFKKKFKVPLHGNKTMDKNSKIFHPEAGQVVKQLIALFPLYFLCRTSSDGLL